MLSLEVYKFITNKFSCGVLIMGEVIIIFLSMPSLIASSLTLVQEHTESG
jgi:hypothetical protein